MQPITWLSVGRLVSLLLVPQVELYQYYILTLSIAQDQGIKAAVLGYSKLSELLPWPRLD